MSADCGGTAGRPAGVWAATLLGDLVGWPRREPVGVPEGGRAICHSADVRVAIWAVTGADLVVAVGATTVLLVPAAPVRVWLRRGAPVVARRVRFGADRPGGAARLIREAAGRGAGPGGPDFRRAVRDERGQPRECTDV